MLIWRRGETEGGREGGREGVREGGREGGREGEGESDNCYSNNTEVTHYDDGKHRCNEGPNGM